MDYAALIRPTALLTMLVLTGLDGVTKPALQNRRAQ
jgi:hypothetical protein